jgi:hypothetical protein
MLPVHGVLVSPSVIYAPTFIRCIIELEAEFMLFRTFLLCEYTYEYVSCTKIILTENYSAYRLDEQKVY